MTSKGGFQAYQKKANVLVSHIEQKLVSLNSMTVSGNYEGCRLMSCDIDIMLENLLVATDSIDEDLLSSGQRLQLHRIRCVYCELSSHLEENRTRVLKEANRQELFSNVEVSHRNEDSASHQILDAERVSITKSTQALEHVLQQAQAGHTNLVSTFNVLVC